MKSDLNISQWLDILVCPKCRGKLKFRQEESHFICENCQLAFPVTDGIPVMLIEEAKKINLEFY
ncbi:MAG TPA: Trm112 family protein [Candidatus Marinimicrobia bacterium]|nr:Trm112 family protein [Candidatus Neomarinimicrobiota bacterium]